jgi:hypothetical protein
MKLYGRGQVSDEPAPGNRVRFEDSGELRGMNLFVAARVVCDDAITRFAFQYDSGCRVAAAKVVHARLVSDQNRLGTVPDPVSASDREG